MKTRSVLLFCLVLALSSAYTIAEASALSALSADKPPKESEAKVYSKNPEANALYIEGLGYLSKGDSRTAGSMASAKKALQIFRQAAKKDPQFALAYIGQAKAIDVLARTVSGGGIAPVKIYRQEEAAALKAAELDDGMPEAHDLLALIYYDNEYDWPKAEKQLKRTIELAPNDPKFHTRYSFFLGSMGRFEEAKAEAKLAQTIDEKYAPSTRALSMISYWEHQDDAAIAHALEALSKDDNLRTHFYLAYVYLHKGQFAKGIEEMKRASFNDADSLAGLAYAYALAGSKTELDDTLERLKHHPAHAYYGMAQVYTAMGDKDRAISFLNKAYQERSSRMNYLKVDPAFDPLRQEPRFKQLMSKMNFNR
jgi:adenylate cyclase